MPVPTITASSYKFEIAGIGSIVVTDAVQQDDSTFVRAIRFYGQPQGIGAEPPLALEVRAVGDTKNAITIATPAAGF